jgi:hypothetical protein
MSMMAFLVVIVFSIQQIQFYIGNEKVSCRLHTFIHGQRLWRVLWQLMTTADPLR